MTIDSYKYLTSSLHCHTRTYLGNWEAYLPHKLKFLLNYFPRLRMIVWESLVHTEWQVDFFGRSWRKNNCSRLEATEHANIDKGQTHLSASRSQLISPAPKIGAARSLGRWLWSLCMRFGIRTPQHQSTWYRQCALTANKIVPKLTAEYVASTRNSF